MFSIRYVNDGALIIYYGIWPFSVGFIHGCIKWMEVVLSFSGRIIWQSDMIYRIFVIVTQLDFF